ncbi:MAG: hypothetical protein ACK58L_06655 [Planctomycetota bacterium]
MKFCVIGDNSAAMSVLRQLVHRGPLSLGACHPRGELSAQAVQEQFPLRLAASPEDAFLVADVEAAVLALNEPEELLRLTRSVSQAEKVAVIVPPPNCVPAFSFELHLILDESQTAIFPVLGRCDLESLAFNQHHLALDPAESLQLSLEMAIDSASPSELRTAVCRGLDLLAASGFRYSQVTAIDSLAPDGTFISRMITLNSQPQAEQPLPPAMLLLRRSSQSDGDTRVTIRQMLTDGRQKEFIVRHAADSNSSELVERVQWLAKNKAACSAWMDAFSATLELAEAVDKSLRRRRTVDVHFDTGSERGVFKSQMTAIGCGVLTYMMLGMVAYLIVAQLMDLPDWALHLGRILWVAPLVLFLVAQFLLPLTRERASGKNSAERIR